MQDENKKSFHQGMKAELKKVIWPTGKQVVKSTVATISFVLLISVILIALNTVFSFVSEKWYDLVLVEDKKTEQSVKGSGDAAANNAVVSGDVASGEITSGENTTVINSGDENKVTE